MHKLASSCLFFGVATSIGTQSDAQVLEVAQDGRATWIGTAIAPSRVRPDGPNKPATNPCNDGPSEAYRDRVGDAAVAVRLHPELAMSLTCQESRFNPQARSPKGAYGLMQLMPQTARGLGVDPHNIESNLKGGTRLLSQLLVRYGGDLQKALAAYNAGPAAVDRYNGVPPYAETRHYVANILDQLATTALTSDSTAGGPVK